MRQRNKKFRKGVLLTAFLGSWSGVLVLHFLWLMLITAMRVFSKDALWALQEVTQLKEVLTVGAIVLSIGILNTAVELIKESLNRKIENSREKEEFWGREISSDEGRSHTSR